MTEVMVFLAVIATLSMILLYVIAAWAIIPAYIRRLKPHCVCALTKLGWIQKLSSTMQRW